MKRNSFVDSPINYSGNKYKLLPKLAPLFPERIDILYDLFCGGGAISANIEANRVVANDINHFVIDILAEFRDNNAEDTIRKIHHIIKAHSLSIDNKESYNEFRYYYNHVDKTPLNLFVLSCFSFNYQFRFNKKGEYNNASGYNSNQYNPNIEQKIIDFSPLLQNVTFTKSNVFDIDMSVISEDDFVYLDPPYSNSTASYNDGKRHFGGWSTEDDKRLFDILDDLSLRGVRWGMSNAFVNKGIENEHLIEWSRKYHCFTFEHNKYTTNYQRKGEKKTVEVYIANYRK